MANIKTVHLPGNGGLADLYDLNGPELSKWIKRECDQYVRDHATAENGKDRAIQERMAEASGWLGKLQHHLLSSDMATIEQNFIFTTLVKSIHRRWTTVTGDRFFPKLHMLLHAVEFQKNHGSLGFASEAGIERHHAAFNDLFHRHHFRLGSNTNQRLLACLRDVVHRAVWPKLVEEEAAAKTPSSPLPARITRSLSEPLSHRS